MRYFWDDVEKRQYSVEESSNDFDIRLAEYGNAGYVEITEVIRERERYSELTAEAEESCESCGACDLCHEISYLSDSLPDEQMFVEA